MGEHEPEEIGVPVIWTGVEETPVVFVNQLMSQFDTDLETFILTFGQLTPPALTGTPEQMREQAEQLSYVAVRTVARVSLSPAKMGEFLAAMGANADQLEAARTMRPGDPR